MSASQDECVAQFPRQSCCNDRLYSRLLSWAGYIVALAMPPTDTAPDVAWVRQRVFAERLPPSASTYLPIVSPYLIEVPQISQDVRTHLNAWNDEATETSLAGEIDQGLATIMPKIADAYVADQEVANWCTKNGYPVPPGLNLSPGAMMPMVTPPLRVVR